MSGKEEGTQRDDTEGTIISTVSIIAAGKKRTGPLSAHDSKKGARSKARRSPRRQVQVKRRTDGTQSSRKDMRRSFIMNLGVLPRKSTDSTTSAPDTVFETTDKTEQSEEDSKRRKRAPAKNDSRHDKYRSETKKKREKLLREVTTIKLQKEKLKKGSRHKSKQKLLSAKKEKAQKHVATQPQRKAISAESAKTKKSKKLRSEKKSRRPRSLKRKKKANSETITVTIEAPAVPNSTESIANIGKSKEQTIQSESSGGSKPSVKKNERAYSVKAICRSKTFTRVINSQECEGDLENQVYYHGFRPRKDVISLLNEPGDFIVRATDSRHKPEIVISVINDKHQLINLTIKNEADKWQLGVLRKTSKNVPRFTKIQELINYYKVHKLPGRAKLQRGIPRPSWLIKHENVVFDRGKDLIGTGNFCHVYKGTYYRTAQEKYVVAIKMSHEGHGSDKDFEETKDARDSMLAEAHMMSYYVHRNIVELYGVACDHPPVLIVMEYCPGGNLELHLLEEKENISTGERIIYALEACRGMVFLHRKNCVHRDLAARNCLISAKGHIKISDFGLSKLVGDLEKMDGTVTDEPAPQIPLRWMAPESLRRPMKFSTKSDVWSFAVLLYEIFNNGQKPWKSEPAKKIATMIRRCQMPAFPKQTPENIVEIATKIWVADPKARPTMKDVNYLLVLASKKYEAPPPEKFVVNNIEGVTRTKAICHYSLEDTAEKEEDYDEHVNDESLAVRTTHSKSDNSASQKVRQTS